MSRRERKTLLENFDLQIQAYAASVRAPLLRALEDASRRIRNCRKALTKQRVKTDVLIVQLDDMRQERDRLREAAKAALIRFEFISGDEAHLYQGSLGDWIDLLRKALGKE